VDLRRLIWEQELYNELVYKVPDQTFHTFEADNCVAGLSFASPEEAVSFREAVNGQQKKRKTRLDVKRSSSQGISGDTSTSPPVLHEVSISTNLMSLSSKKPARFKQ